MQLATWNVNSLRARLERVQAWVQRHQPDVLCLQETKCQDANFPREALESLGYHLRFTGEESGLNGVATLTREEPRAVLDCLPGREDDTQRRFLSLEVGGVRVINVYVPNGQSLGSDAFFFKLDWLSRLVRHLKQEHDPAQPLALVGDFNICPEDRDAWDAEARAGGIHVSPIERRSLGFLLEWGLRDCHRQVDERAGVYTWFDYRKTFKEFSAEQGLRIDLILATEPLAVRLQRVEVDLEERAGEQPSDHAPLVASFADA